MIPSASNWDEKCVHCGDPTSFRYGAVPTHPECYEKFMEKEESKK